MSRFRIAVTLLALIFGLAGPLSSQPAKKTILFLGDSLTAGYGLDPDQAYPALIQQRIDRAGEPYRVINAGLSGDTSAGGAGRIDWLLRQKVDILVLGLGANDGLRGVPVDTTRRNLQAIIDKTRQKYPQVKIVVAGMMMPPNWGAQYTRQFRQLFIDLADKNGAALIPFLLEGVGGRPEMNLPDGIHPNLQGQRVVAENVWKVLQSLLD